MKRFYLGIPEVYWLRRATFPTFVSHRRFQNRVITGRRVLPRAINPWALDSGGFTEVLKHGADAYANWPPREYAAWVSTYIDEVGLLEWATIQDWMCEPEMLTKTGKTVRQHQSLTTHSYLDLMALRPWLPWVPVLQGYDSEDYKRHVEEYQNHGVELANLPVVGLGSVCRRQRLEPIVTLCSWLKRQGLRIHGFGVNKSGLPQLAKSLESSDSMAWVADAAHKPPLAGHTHLHCTSCFEYACLWRNSADQLLARSSFEYLFSNPFAGQD